MPSLRTRSALVAGATVVQRKIRGIAADGTESSAAEPNAPRNGVG
ncbi:hypothetical protein ACWC2M_24195 [Streptomyces sp. NPDC001761]